MENYYPLITVAAYIAGGFLLHWVIMRIIKLVEKKYQPNALHWGFLNNFMKIIIAVVIIYALFESIPQLSSVSTVLLTSSSIVVAAIGLASQKPLSNALGGIIISFAKPFAVGDRVRLVGQNVTGFVENVNLRHTVIRTVENNRLLIPNITVLDDIIENLNYVDTRICNFLDVGINFGSDIGLAQSIIVDTIIKNPRWIDTRSDEDKDNGVPVIRVMVRDISSHRIELRAGVWADSITDSFILCSEARKEIAERLTESGISLYRPFTPEYYSPKENP